MKPPGSSALLGSWRSVLLLAVFLSSAVTVVAGLDTGGDCDGEKEKRIEELRSQIANVRASLQQALDRIAQLGQAQEVNLREDFIIMNFLKKKFSSFFF